jgi:hypothetical protein
LAVVVLQSVVPAAAAGQFGGLAKKAKQAAEGAVEAQLPFTPQPAPEYSDRVLEITADRLDQLFLGFKAEVASAKTAKKEYEDLLKNAESARADYERARATYDQNSATYQGCAASFRDREFQAASENEAAMEKILAEMNTEEFEQYMESLATRGEAFAQRGVAGTLDPATDRAWQAYAREIQVMQREQERRMKAVMAGMSAELERDRTENPRLVAACGKAPIAPTDPTQQLSGPEAVMLGHGAEAAAFEGTDPSPAARVQRYAIMRERVINWMAEKGRPAKMGFSAAEVSVLQAAGDRLNQAEKDLKKAGVPF